MGVSQTKNLIYLALNLLIAASVLGMVSFMIGIRDDFAMQRNDVTSGKHNVIEYLQYNKYNQQEVTGLSAIEGISMYGKNGMQILLSRMHNDEGTVKEWNSICECGFESETLFDLQHYVLHSSIFNTSTLLEDEEADLVQKWIGQGDDMFSIMVYNGQNPTELMQDLLDEYRLDGLTNSTTRDRKIQFLTEHSSSGTVYDTASGMILIDLGYFGD